MHLPPSLSANPGGLRRRHFLALTAKSSAALLLLRSVPSAGAASGEKVLSWFMWGNTDAEVSLWKEIAALAQKQVPNLQIQLTTAGWNDYWTKLTMQAASSGMQDLISIQSQRTPQFASAFQSLDPLIKSQNFDLKAFDSTILSALTFDGGLRALPYDFGPYIIFYNRDLFKRDHVDEPNVNWTYDEFLTAAKKLTHGNQYGFAAFPYPDFCFPFVLSNGATYLNEQGEIDVVSSPFVKAFETYAQLVYKDHIAPQLPATQDANTAWSLWSAGNAAMVVSGPWDVVNAKSSVKFDFGLAKIPKGSKGSITIAGGSGFGISLSAKDKELAFKAVTALTSDEAEERLASAGRAFPARKAQQTFWYKNAPAGSEEVLNATLNGGVVPFKTTTNWQQFNLLLVQYGIPVMNGQTSAATALKQVQSQLSG
ncbi:MAG: sugar ABC transporter substrate-binding protein [Verrucomicrobia bacterium]|nr:sugar ABC transporter substrate-binding protein [Verrucomicrobiota bacterium]